MSTARSFLHDPANPASLSSNDVKCRTWQESCGHRLRITTGSGPRKNHRSRQWPRAHPRAVMGTARKRLIEDRRGTLWIYHANGSGPCDDRSQNADDDALFLSRRRGEANAGLRHLRRTRGSRTARCGSGTGGQGLLRFDADQQRFFRYRSNSGDHRASAVTTSQRCSRPAGQHLGGLYGASLNLAPGRKPAFLKSAHARPGYGNDRAEKWSTPSWSWTTVGCGSATPAREVGVDEEDGGARRPEPAMGSPLGRDLDGERRARTGCGSAPWPAPAC